jgi:hypothetical protein
VGIACNVYLLSATLVSCGWLNHLTYQTDAVFGYGSIPRLLLFWLTTEALRTGSPKLELGKTYGSFIRDLGLDPNTGGGKRSDGHRVRIQTRRLFMSRVSFIREQRADDLEVS